MFQNNGTALTLFLTLLTLSAAALGAAWVLGRQWGDLASRRHYGEALSAEEQAALKRSRRSFWIWAGASLFFAVLAFYTLR